MARLDRLGAAKEVAQIGAIIGREFSYGLLAAVARRPDAELKSALDRLIEAGLLFRQGVPPNATYLFKHALVQDAALRLATSRAAASDTRPNRRSYRKPIQRDCREPTRAAYGRHFSEAGRMQQAIRLSPTRRRTCREAISQSRGRHTLPEGTAIVLERLPDRAAYADHELKLLIALGPALMATRSSTAPEIGNVYARARELAHSAASNGGFVSDHLGSVARCC